MKTLFTQVKYKHGNFFHFGEILTLRSHEIFFDENFYQIIGNSVWIPESSLLDI